MFSICCRRAIPGQLLGVSWIMLFCLANGGVGQNRPNVLVAISDDQSYPHASAYGAPVIRTPAFDEVARRGMLFHNAFTPAPGCSPMRAAFLSGQYIWQLREAGTHASHFPRDIVTFPEVLEAEGYAIGYTGKPWSPGKHAVSGWDRNPAGPAFNQKKNQSPKGISGTDYAENFKSFLEGVDDDQPFCFWYGASEPHRVFDKGIGARNGMDASQVKVPDFLPDAPEIRSDLLDYFYEIQWFDQHLGKMLRELEARGELENTLVVVTSDNGMSFPRAKANVYEYGIHMPLAIALPQRFAKGKQTDELVNLIDVTATIYDVCGIDVPPSVAGGSLVDLLSGKPTREREAAFSGRERHSSSRFNSLSYPQRCVRTKDFLYIRNYTPERWPAGAPRKYSQVQYDSSGKIVRSKLGPEHGGYHDIDACPTLNYMIENRKDAKVGELFHLSVDKRPAEEFYRIHDDPSCLIDLAHKETSRAELVRHRKLLHDKLVETNDLRETDFAASHIWETYPRYSSLRWFPEPDWWKERPVPSQPWLEERRPREQ